MRNLIIYISALCVLAEGHAFDHGAAQLRDLLAHPKYEVQFLNDLPVSQSDADRANTLGLEREEEWLDLRLSLDRQRVGDGMSVPSEDRLDVIPMSLTPPGSTTTADYLCLMPSKNSTDAQTVTASAEELDEHEELDPAQSWAALSHLDGKCLYSKQGWFTYSYCHNSHIRQFREARHHHPHPPGGHEPEEDENYDAYTLGQISHSSSLSRRRSRSLPPGQSRHDPSNQQTHQNQNQDADQDQNQHSDSHGTPAPSNSVSFGLGASSRYLLQRWSDGTPCDKTGKPREVEVQAHCSMTTTDTIYLVKEMAICQYVIVIHSPHLCSLPGFRAPHADVDPAGIRCRQVIKDDAFEEWMGGQERQGTLRLPWTKPPKELPTSFEHVDEGQKGQEGQHGKDGPRVGGKLNDGFTLREINDEDLQAVLQQALDALTRHGHEGEMNGDDDQVMFVALEEDEDGRLFLDAEMSVQGDDQEGGGGAEKVVVDGEQRDKLLTVVKRYLESRGEIEHDDNEREEDGRKRQKDEL